MKNLNKMTALTLAVSLAIGAGLAVAAEQASSSEDHSSSATQAMGDAWLTAKVKVAQATADAGGGRGDIVE